MYIMVYHHRANLQQISSDFHVSKIIKIGSFRIKLF